MNELKNAMQEYMDSVYCVSHLVPMKKKLVENGYQCYIMAEHTLLDDELWVHPDTIKAHVEGSKNPKYIFVYKDKFLNEWSSTQIQRRYSKLSKKHIKVLEKYEVI